LIWRHPSASQDDGRGSGGAGELVVTPYARIHQARKLIRAQGLLHVVGRPKLHGLKVAAHVEALGQHHDRQVPVDLDGPLDQEAALEIPAPLTDNDQVKAVLAEEEGSLSV
jgi:hypothetical protein